MILAVALHNIPEGMAVGVVFGGVLSGETDLTIAGALALSIGMAIQNIPEGAIISVPLRDEGKSAGKAFVWGAASGLVEPIAALATMFFLESSGSAMPILLSFAAGAMLYVVVEELIPETQQGEHSNIGTIAFAMGFIVMMILDVAMA
jgi:ZIP family zinc transporter